MMMMMMIKKDKKNIALLLFGSVEQPGKFLTIC